MAKATLPVNYVDDTLNSAMDGRRRYKVINNADGTISLEDATTYDQVGSNFGASQLNTIGKAINESADSGKIIDDIETIRATTQEGYIAGALALKAVDSSLTNENSETFNFGVKDGVRGFFTNPSRADDSFVPFKSNFKIIYSGGNVTNDSTVTIKLNEPITNAYIFIAINKPSATCSIGEFVGSATDSNSGLSMNIYKYVGAEVNTFTIGLSSLGGRYCYMVVE